MVRHMSADTRIAELERRLARDPASIAFAQLAEEYRRAGRLDDAIRVCRDGLTRHASYPSARVTLGRALLAQGLHDAARVELEAVAALAPDNLAARRALEGLGRATAVPAETSDEQAVLTELEGWLEAIRLDRVSRTAGGPNDRHV